MAETETAKAFILLAAQMISVAGEGGTLKPYIYAVRGMGAVFWLQILPLLGTGGRFPPRSVRVSDICAPGTNVDSKAGIRRTSVHHLSVRACRSGTTCGSVRG